MERIRSFLSRALPLLAFRGSGKYWESRYRLGGNSGAGSRGINASYKADVLNSFIATHDVASMIEFGCGDGYQLAMFDVKHYTGVDVSKTVLEQCRAQYAEDPSKTFIHLDAYAGQQADLAVSLDVIFHLVEDLVYEQYMQRLFASGARYVAIYSTSAESASTGTSHVRHRDCAAYAQRFSQFERMPEVEADLPPPVRFDRGLPTSFFFYRRHGS